MFIAAVIYPLLVRLGYFVVKFKWFRSKISFLGRFPSDVPPGSMGWPFIGDYLSFLLPQKAHYMSKYFLERCFRYGPVFKCSPFGVPTLVSCDLELNNFILQNEGILFASDYPKPIRKALGAESVIFSSGQLHKRLRSLAVSFISTSNVSPDFISYIEKLSIIIMDTWRKEGKKEIVFYKEAQIFMLYYVLKRVLDIDIGDEKAAKIQEDIFTILGKGFSYIPGRTQARVKKARTRIRENLTAIISERLKQNKLTLKAEWNDEDIVNVMLGLLMSLEPNASLMTLVVYFLARSPRAILELKNEHESMGEPLSLEDHRKMDFTLKVINETLRCGNVTKYVYRKALKDVRYKGYLIPSGWRVIPFITGTHLNPSLHENPYEFNPWRWDYKETKREVMPFGGGLKICPGAEFAKHSVAFFLHHFVLNFNWKIRLDECPVSRPFMGSEKELVLEIEPAAME
uniref:CYP450 n=1 Tax=Gentiana crassa subsp. rigescens TaxID=3097545 RepID=A0A1N7T5P8_9GENT|nr:CYP450 [Gentiana rigescens]